MSCKYLTRVAVIGVCFLMVACSPAPQSPAVPENSVQPEPQAQAAQEAQALQEPPEQLLAKWMELAKTATKEKPNIDEALVVAGKLAGQDRALLNPLLDVLADAGSTPLMKILAGFSLRPGLNPQMTPRLIELTKQDKEGTTRSCAVELLAAVQGQEVTDVLLQLKDDSERRVKFQAIRALALRDGKYRKDLFDLYKAPDTSASEKGSIVAAFCTGVVSPDCLWLMEEAAADQALDEVARVMAVDALGAVGVQAELPKLIQLAQTATTPNLKSAADKAVQKVQARISQAGATAPPAPVQK